MTRITFLLVAGITLLRASPATAKVQVVTTIQTLKALTEEVGGDKVRVEALVGESVDPHYVEPRPSHALTLKKADLLIHVGLDLERGWLPSLVEQSRNPRIQTGKTGNLDASSAGISIMDQGAQTSRAQGDIHPRGNPHYWLSPENARAVARAIAKRLGEIDAANASHYQGRLAAFERELEARRAAWEKRASPLKGIQVVTYHKSWTYLTRWLGIVELGYIEPKPGIPPSPSHLAQLVKRARSAGAKMVLVESYYPHNTARKVADLAKMRMVDVPPDAKPGETYMAYMDRLLSALLAAQ